MQRTLQAYYNHQRRAREAGTVLDYTVEQLRELISATRQCHYCSKAVADDTFHLDHAEPTSRGGRHSIANIAVTCPTCNYAKGELTYEEFWQLIQLVNRWPERIRRGLMARLKAGGRLVRC
jgi:5-methylcytosine-specific restriction endonuclease McrA